MKVILRGYGIRMTSEERQVARAQARDMTITRGTGRTPQPPSDVIVQSGPRGILLNWRKPSGQNIDIAGYRVYKDTEMGLFAEIKEPNTTQHFIEATAGSTPPVVNLFVSSVNQLGVESPLVPVQGSAVVEAGAPSMPSTPPTYGAPRYQGFGCPISGAPVKLYGDPSWWTKTVEPCTDFIEMITESGRRGMFSTTDLRYCHMGLIQLSLWKVGWLALTEDGEEKVTALNPKYDPYGEVDHYEATQGHIYSAWGFIGHNKQFFSH